MEPSEVGRPRAGLWGAGNAGTGTGTTGMVPSGGTAGRSRSPGGDGGGSGLALRILRARRFWNQTWGEAKRHREGRRELGDGL